MTAVDPRFADPIASFGEHWTKVDVEEVIAHGGDRLPLLPILLGLHATDTTWAASICLGMAANADTTVRGNALLGWAISSDDGQI